MDKHPEQDPEVEAVWREYLTSGGIPKHYRQPWYEWKIWRPLVRHLPDNPRCRICYFPFEGIGGWLSKTLIGLEPSKMNPQVCNVCERFANKFRGGTELEVSMLFADIRGSTSLAEGIRPAEFSQKINRFYKAVTDVLFDTKAFVEKLIGDEVVGFYVPGFAGEKHAQVAIDAARKILEATGHADPSGPWIPVGVGVHTGLAYVGSVEVAEGMSDIALLGDAVNTTARLASQAGPGEAVISEATRVAAGLEPQGMQSRQFNLKGKSEVVDAWVLSVAAQPPFEHEEIK
jgi:adenylate cyclase